MNEAYQIAMQRIKALCEAHKAENGQYPNELSIDDQAFEALRAGQHADRNATQIVIPLLYEDSPIAVLFSQQTDPVKPLWFVVVTKAEKAA